MERKKENKQDNRKQMKGEKENYYALMAVIFNKEMSVDSAIKYFNL